MVTNKSKAIRSKTSFECDKVNIRKRIINIFMIIFFVFIIINIFRTVAFATLAEDDTYGSILLEYEEYFELRTLLKDLLRFLSWGLIKIVYTGVSFVESLLNESISFFGFVEYLQEESIYTSLLSLVIAAVMAGTLLWISIKMIFNYGQVPQLKTLGANLVVAIILITGMPFLMAWLQEGVEIIWGTNISSSEEGEGDNSVDFLDTSTQVVKDNVVDLYYPLEYDTDFAEYFEGDNKNTIKDSDSIKYIDSGEFFLYDTDRFISDNAEILDKFLVPLTNEEGDLEHYVMEQEDDGWFMSKITPDRGYYRYTYNTFTILVVLIALGVAFIYILFNIISVYIELGFKLFASPIVLATDLETGQKTKKVIQDIIIAFLTIAFEVISLRLFVIYFNWLQSNVDDTMLYLIGLVAGVFVLLRGSKTILAWFGVDLGMQEGRSMFGSFLKYSGARAVGRAGVKGAKAGARGLKNFFGGKKDKSNDQNNESAIAKGKKENLGTGKKDTTASRYNNSKESDFQNNDTLQVAQNKNTEEAENNNSVIGNESDEVFSEEGSIVIGEESIGALDKDENEALIKNSGRATGSDSSNIKGNDALTKSAKGEIESIVSNGSLNLDKAQQEGIVKSMDNITQDALKNNYSPDEVKDMVRENISQGLEGTNLSAEKKEDIIKQAQGSVLKNVVANRNKETIPLNKKSEQVLSNASKDISKVQGATVGEKVSNLKENIITAQSSPEVISKNMESIVSDKSLNLPEEVQGSIINSVSNVSGQAVRGNISNQEIQQKVVENVSKAFKGTNIPKDRQKQVIKEVQETVVSNTKATKQAINEIDKITKPTKRQLEKNINTEVEEIFNLERQTVPKEVSKTISEVLIGSNNNNLSPEKTVKILKDNIEKINLKGNEGLKEKLIKSLDNSLSINENQLQSNIKRIVNKFKK